eukprot:TRINITY_DN128_c0_g1_i4.p1 TRINITY_DN128_c0_g1~~TRINITY_DN128_c0_g1_i4.p1  ORF type:complete len:165 (+),score=54.67 TRINITY_DN128_c0_g1_i4:308-802(+)
MEIELAVLNSQAKSELQPRVRKYRSDFDTTRRQVAKSLQLHKQKVDRETLMGAHIDEGNAENNGRLLNHQEILARQNAALEGAIRVGYETGAVAVDIERDLKDQNVRAAKTQGKVRSMQGLLGDSDSIISRMLRREKLNKLILTALCVLLLVAVLVILYFKVFK